MAAGGNADFYSVCNLVMELGETLRKSQDIMEKLRAQSSPLIATILTIDDPTQQIHVVNQLIVDGADVNGKDSLGKTPLMHATNLGYKKTVELLLDSPDIDLLQVDGVGNTALMMAARGNRSEMVQMIICKAMEHGSDTLSQLLQTENTNGERAFTIALRESVDCANLISQSWVHLADARKGKKVKSSSVELPVLKRVISLAGHESPPPQPQSSGSSPSPSDEMQLAIRSKIGARLSRRFREQSHSVRSLDRMLMEKRNVASSHKAQKFFQVNKTGGPLTQSYDDFILMRSSGSSHAVESLSRRLKSVLCTGKQRSEFDLSLYAVGSPTSGGSTPPPVVGRSCRSASLTSRTKRRTNQRTNSEIGIETGRGARQKEEIKLPPLKIESRKSMCSFSNSDIGLGPHLL